MFDDGEDSNVSWHISIEVKNSLVIEVEPVQYAVSDGNK